MKKTIALTLLSLSVSFTASASKETSCEMLNRASESLKQAHYDKAIKWAYEDLVSEGFNVSYNDMIVAHGFGVHDFISDEIKFICSLQPSADTWDIASRVILNLRKLQITR